MNISAKTEYACVALLHLAANYGTDRTVNLRAISEAHGIPARFLVQILAPLKSAGLLSSTRGAAGGYRMLIDPSELSLRKVMSFVEAVPEKLVSKMAGDSPYSQVLMDTWNSAYSQNQELLESITLSDLLQNSGKQDGMYYI